MNNINQICFHEHKFGSFNIDDTFESRDTLQSLVQSCSCGHNRDRTSPEKPIRSPGGGIQECQHHHQPRKNKRSVTSDSSRNSSLNSFMINVTEVCIYSKKINFKLLLFMIELYMFFYQQEKEQSTVSCGGAALFDSINVVSRKDAMKTKKAPRIRWNRDLDKKFIESVDRLGGARSKYENINKNVFFFFFWKQIEKKNI